LEAGDGLIERISRRLLREPDGRGVATDLVPDWMPEEPFEGPPIEAAVLLAVIVRDGRASVLYTQRAAHLRSHSGQIAFPGGKIDPGDLDAGDAALREAHEEVALRREDARVLGYLPRYFSGTNYLITPVVAVVRPSAPWVPNPAEVHSVFEVPLHVVALSGSYGAVRTMRGATERTGWQLRHESRTIWGITALLTRQFRDLALAEEVV